MRKIPIVERRAATITMLIKRPRTTREIAHFTGMDCEAASVWLRALMAEGLVDRTRPEPLGPYIYTWVGEQ